VKPSELILLALAAGGVLYLIGQPQPRVWDTVYRVPDRDARNVTTAVGWAPGLASRPPAYDARTIAPLGKEAPGIAG
jgi:hypothetical protein